jgi:hypothetical protein
MNTLQKTVKNENGATALLLVLIVSAAASAWALGAARSGMNEMEAGHMVQEAEAVAYVGEGCVEEALGRLRTDANYAGGTLEMSGASCAVSVSASGSSRTVTARVAAGNYHKRIQVDATLFDRTITVQSWKEVSL